MPQIIYSIDRENIFNGGMEQYQITSWAAGINGKAAELKVINENGKELASECEGIERPDVLKKVKKLSNGAVEIGFDLLIPDWMNVLKNNEKIIVVASDGEHEKNIYYQKTEELLKSMDEQSMQLNIDA